MTPFHVGMKVVCITDSSDWEWASPEYFGLPGEKDGPVSGQILVIEEINSNAGTVYLGFPEWPEDEFKSDHFRPVVKTDISIFTAMLAPSPKQRVKA